MLMEGLRFCQVVVNQERDLVKAFFFRVAEGAREVNCKEVEEVVHGEFSF